MILCEDKCRNSVITEPLRGFLSTYLWNLLIRDLVGEVTNITIKYHPHQSWLWGCSKRPGTFLHTLNLNELAEEEVGINSGSSASPPPVMAIEASGVPLLGYMDIDTGIFMGLRWAPEPR